MWKTINSAPLDKNIDIFSSSYGRVADARWNKVYKHWESWGYSEFDSRAWGKVGGVISHWMEIPNDPIMTLAEHDEKVPMRPCQEAAEIIKTALKWKAMSASEMRLHLGEATSQEIRTVRAVLKQIIPED